MIKSSTKITFPGGNTSGQSIIIHIEDMKNDPTKTMLFVEETPFHPLDNRWPDQPGDKGLITIDGEDIILEECLTATYNQNTKEILLDKEIIAKRNDSECFFLVAHVFDKNIIEKHKDLIGKKVELKVDKDYRYQLSKVHSTCHLAALALNKSTNKYWKKEFKKDSLGNFDLDSIAVMESKISEKQSFDRYRLGKSVRKKGFDSALFLAEIDSVAKEMNLQIKNWMSNTLEISILPKIAYLNDVRKWTCLLPDGKAEILCGGTHVTKLSTKDSFQINLKKEDSEFIMETIFAKNFV
ncbi:MAG: hypothetical protein ACFFG0_22465 [Candidatus Thorarchaeota archaeon]